MSITLEDLNKETLIELIEKLRSNSGALTEQKYTAFEMEKYAKEHLAYKEWADSLKKALRRLVNAVDINPELAKEVQPANEAAKKLLTEYYNYKENTSI